MADDTVDESGAEIVSEEEPAPRESSQFLPAERREREWRPSPLAGLTKEQFTERLASAKLGIDRIQQLQRGIMRLDVDYGEIPGTKGNTLYQPGAQVLNAFMGYRASYQVERVYGDGDERPAFSVHAICALIDKRTGEEVAQGFGEANTHEKRYRYRFASKRCPACGAEAVHRSQFKPGWYCNDRRGGCKSQFEDGSDEASAIVAQQGMVINPDPLDLAVVILKMACKRAYIHATVYAHACSGIFAQDVEDGVVPDAEEQAAAQAYSGGPAKGRGRRKQQSPQNQNDKVNESQVLLLRATFRKTHQAAYGQLDDKALLVAETEFLEQFRVNKFDEVTKGRINEVLAAMSHIGEGEAGE